MEPKRRTLDDGEEHFANEWLTQQLMEDKDRTWPLGNPFDLREFREIPPRYDYDVLRVHEALKGYVDPDLHDWRDGEKIEDMVREK
ncbi:hypothetical protein ES703_64206 [subsurface metagenome]